MYYRLIPHPHRKQLLIAGAFVAILILGLSLFADTAGGVSLNYVQDIAGRQNSDTALRTQTAGNILSLDNAGADATVAAAHYNNSASASPTDASPSSGVRSTASSGQSVNTTPSNSSPVSQGNTSTSTTPVTLVAPPNTPCAECPVSDNDHAMTPCADYCVTPKPTPYPGCLPCGGFRETKSNDPMMCPM